MMGTGMLGEGMGFLRTPCTDTALMERSIDGIHIDMNHLKKGEVK